MNDQLETLASTDLLTGLKNRRFFQEKMLESLMMFQEKQRYFSLLVVDIDHFKSINDTYGHPIGDLVLGNLAGLLQSLSRSTDVVACYGGEEFVVILNALYASKTGGRNRVTHAAQMVKS
ncbi:GGDEF domain-containing protein [Paenibacillus xylanexedens]|uniref:GGDEF domain-containing protein n=1 Tax=Paenibacillus xylanexedens TaxID=528191 RepID=UPI003D060228